MATLDKICGAYTGGQSHIILCINIHYILLVNFINPLEQILLLIRCTCIYYVYENIDVEFYGLNDPESQ